MIIKYAPCVALCCLAILMIRVFIPQYIRAFKQAKPALDLAADVAGDKLAEKIKKIRQKK